MKRTAKDVVDEWRNSVVNNDDGELVSRINYWAVTDFCPSFAHPGLGSGALRERLCERITSYLTLGGLFNAELMNHDAVRELLSDCRVGLSLSSPIEPPRGAEQLLNEFIGYISVEYQWQQERWENCQKLAKLFLAALPPSRQGAGGK